MTTDIRLSEDCIHVMFWEGKEMKMKTSCADVHYTMVRQWTDRESAHELVQKNRRRKDWNESVDLAEDMVLLTPGSQGRGSTDGLQWMS